MKIKFTVDNKTIFQIMAVIVGFWLTLLAISIAWVPLVLVGLSFFLAIALNPAVAFLAKRVPGKSRSIATALAYLVVLFLLGSIVSATVPSLVKQSQQLIRDLPEYVDSLRTSDNFIAQAVRDLDLVEVIKDSQDELTSRLSDSSGPIIDTLGSIGSNISAVFIILIMTFFMLVEGPAWIDKFWRLQDKKKQTHRRRLATKMYHVVTSYVNGQLIIASLSATAAFIALTILQIDFALPLAAIVGIFGLIPLVGATIGAIIAVSVALFKSAGAALILAIFFLLYQFIENNVIQPLVQSKTLEMSPLLILVAVVIGAHVSGILGAILAIPIAACIRILVNDYLHRHHIEEEITKTKLSGKLKKAKS